VTRAPSLAVAFTPLYAPAALARIFAKAPPRSAFFFSRSLRFFSSSVSTLAASSFSFASASSLSLASRSAAAVASSAAFDRRFEMSSVSRPQVAPPARKKTRRS